MTGNKIFSSSYILGRIVCIYAMRCLFELYISISMSLTVILINNKHQKQPETFCNEKSRSPKTAVFVSASSSHEDPKTRVKTRSI